MPLYLPISQQTIFRVTPAIYRYRTATPISRESPLHVTPTDGVLADDFPSHTA